MPSPIKEILKTAKGMVLDGIGASEHIDSSGEILSVKGCDISDIHEGIATCNFEHKDDSASDTVGKILYGKKIYSAEDCEDERQLMYWEKSGVPLIYIIVELFDQEGHKAAEDLAAMIRYYASRKMPLLNRFSIEGSTLKKEGNKLQRSVLKRMAITSRPCNKDAISDLLFDPLDSKKKSSSTLKTIVDKIDKFEHPAYSKLGGSVEVECMPWVNLNKREDLLPGGAADDASESDFDPEQLKMGIKHELEHTKDERIAKEIAMDHLKEDPKYYSNLELKEKVKTIAKSWDGTGTLKTFLKSQLPEISDEFLDKFAEAVDQYQIKTKKFEALVDTIQTVLAKVEAATAEPIKLPDEIEFQGKRVKPGVGVLYDRTSPDVKSRDVALLGHDADEHVFYGIPKEKINGWSDQDLMKIPSNGITLHEYPEEINTPPIVDSGVHGVNLTPNAAKMVHGMDLDPKKSLSIQHVGSNIRASWMKSPTGQTVFVKPDYWNEGAFGDATRESAYHNVANEVFGLGHYLPTVAAIKHPRTGQLHTVVEAVPGEHSEATRKETAIPSNQEHINALNKLGDSGELDKLGIMDTILNNNDRHHENYLFTPDGSIKLIDHGMAFPEGAHDTMENSPDYLNKYNLIRQTQGLPKHEDTPLHPETLKWLMSVNPTALKRSLRKNGVPLVSASESVRRLQAMQAHAMANPQAKRFDIYNAPTNALMTQAKVV